ncbi:putative sulfate exporter family transporter [Aerococcaceae bacterium NML130460]|nr:putative sulfate exporter family transporter [Aerococcaceae bacterium NML130460]
MLNYLTLALVTALAYFIGQQFPLIGSSLSAILIGAIVAHSPLHTQLHLPQFKKISSTLLKYGIIVLGLTLSFATLSGIGVRSLLVTLPVIVGSFLTAIGVGRLLHVKMNGRLLVGVGTAICGGSAIAAAAPVIEAEEDEIAFAIATIFLFNMMALVVFPVVGAWLGYDDLAFGVFAGSAINDTSSVVAAGFAFSEQAGEIATVVKLVRTLMIVPACLALIGYRYYHLRQEGNPITLRQVRNIVPQFVIWFILAVIIATFVPIPTALTYLLKQIARILMTMALAAVGLSMNFKQLRTAGLPAILLGGITWLAVILVSIVLIAIFFQ